MFRIRQIDGENLRNEPRLKEELTILLLENFSDIDSQRLKAIFQVISKPFARGFHHRFFVAEHSGQGIQGAALCSHYEELNFLYLDYIVASQRYPRGGVGGALYQRIRGTASRLGIKGLFFECAPDTKEHIVDAVDLKQNRARTRFYERAGARLVLNTEFEKPRANGSTWSLMFDSLDLDPVLSKKHARSVVEIILAKKNKKDCPAQYRRDVIESFCSNPVELRATSASVKSSSSNSSSPSKKDSIFLVQSEAHDIHHVRDKDYFERPIRIRELRRGLDRLDIFYEGKVKHFADKHILAVHDKDFYHYLKKIARTIKDGEFIYPEVFPLRRDIRMPRDLVSQAGYYSTDSFTPLSRNALHAARDAVNCALSAAEQIAKGRKLAYALVRPPGHHAESKSFGGFCYLNSTAIAANYLSNNGKVAILDLDYHHGNGQQDIFYQRSDVLTVSIHADPNKEYPHFSGHADETGKGRGKGYNVNYPLPLQQTPTQYMSKLRKALKRIEEFGPEFLVVALGFDTAKGDPTGTWSLNKKDFNELGKIIARASCPILLVQEGGYHTRSLAANAQEFFQGLWSSSQAHNS
jgi:acetoin utilization deacetylase AcuC-like enzyme/GNAT superfamily N-acetyltransferase